MGEEVFITRVSLQLQFQRAITVSSLPELLQSRLMLDCQIVAFKKHAF